MGILFLILKIIGFILLGLLALLVLVLLAVLFIPIRYRVMAQYEKTAIAQVSVSWLLHLIGVRLVISGQEKSCKLKFLGIPLFDFLAPHKAGKKKRKGKNGKNKKSANRKPVQNTQAKQATADRKDLEKQSLEKQSLDKRSLDKQSLDRQSIDKTSVELSGTEKDQSRLQLEKEWQQIESESEERKQSDEINSLADVKASDKEKIDNQSNFSDNIDRDPDDKASFFKKVKIYAGKVSDKIKKIRKKETNLKEQCNKWLTVLKRDRTKEALQKCKTTVCKVIKAVLPRKWKMYVHYGLEDPALTADILGYYWMLFAVLSGHIDCQPDFENKVFEFNLHAKGHIRMITMGIAGWKFLFDPDLIYLRKIKKEVDSL